MDRLLALLLLGISVGACQPQAGTVPEVGSFLPTQAIEQQALPPKEEIGLQQEVVDEAAVVADNHLQAVRLQEKVRDLTGQLLASSREYFDEDSVVAVTTFANVNDLYKTSSLGRFLSEQFVGELQNAGIGVVELRKTAAILVHRGLGEYGLSRDMDELGFVHPGGVILAGTYNPAADQVFVNVRMLAGDDGRGVAAVSTVLEQNTVVAELLGDERGPMPGHRLQTVQVTGQ